VLVRRGRRRSSRTRAREPAAAPEHDAPKASPRRMPADLVAPATQRSEVDEAYFQPIGRAPANRPGRPSTDHRAPYRVDADRLIARLGAGRPPPAEIERELRARFGVEAAEAVVHDDADADYVAKALGANALAVGGHVAFRAGRYRPGTPAGRELIAHEVGHVAESSARDGGTAGAVQLDVSVDDVTEEMVGQAFTLREAHGSPPDQIPKGAMVTVVDWNGTDRLATIESKRDDGSSVETDVPKLDLEPVVLPVGKVPLYHVGLAGQQKTTSEAASEVEQQRQRIAAWQAAKEKYQKKPEYWAERLAALDKELTRREGILDRKEETLSRMLVRETMYNLFDPQILTWVDHYNQLFKPAKDLDPAIVKSILFQESRLGTSGKHLVLPPYDWSSSTAHPIKSRQNIGQTIDSWPEQQLIMIKEMAPAIYAAHDLADLEQAHRETPMSNVEFAAWEGGKFRRAIKAFLTKRTAAGENLMGTPGRDLYVDYGFWIRTAVRWLFHKYLSLPAKSRSWAAAVRAYNGAGHRARNYRRAVMRRVGKKSFTVGNK
jgi:hypothetical protein